MKTIFKNIFNLTMLKHLVLMEKKNNFDLLLFGIKLFKACVQVFEHTEKVKIC